MPIIEAWRKKQWDKSISGKTGTSLETLNLPLPIYFKLRNRGIDLVEELIECTKEDLKDLLPPNQCKQIQEILKLNSISLRIPEKKVPYSLDLHREMFKEKIKKLYIYNGVEHLIIPRRTVNILACAGLIKIGQLLELSLQQLEETKGVGKTSAQRIHDALFFYFFNDYFRYLQKEQLEGRIEAMFPFEGYFSTEWVKLKPSSIKLLQEVAKI